MGGLKGRPWRRMLELVLQTYGPTCWYCWQEIDLALDRQTDPMGYTVDHSMARANGGSKLDIANLRPMHRRCNSLKGTSDRGPQAHTRAEW